MGSTTGSFIIGGKDQRPLVNITVTTILCAINLLLGFIFLLDAIRNKVGQNVGYKMSKYLCCIRNYGKSYSVENYIVTNNWVFRI